MYKDLVQRDDKSDYLVVYIEEAHATDEWPISSSRYVPSGEPVNVRQPRSVEDRAKLARDLLKMYGIEEGERLKVAVDSPEGNAFEKAYAPWPVRMYVIEDGVVQFLSAPTDSAHDAAGLRDWLEERHAEII